MHLFHVIQLNQSTTTNSKAEMCSDACLQLFPSFKKRRSKIFAKSVRAETIISPQWVWELLCCGSIMLFHHRKVLSCKAEEVELEEILSHVSLTSWFQNMRDATQHSKCLFAFITTLYTDCYQCVGFHEATRRG